MKVRKGFEPKTVLENWRVAVELIPEMNEVELKKALDAEVATSGNRRVDLIRRLHRRFCTLRQNRELDELLDEQESTTKKRRG